MPDMNFWLQNCVGPSFPQCFNLRGNAGRNILIGPGVTSLDFSIFKNNYIKKISERFNVQFRAEIFNILNHSITPILLRPPHPRTQTSSTEPERCRLVRVC